MTNTLNFRNDFCIPYTHIAEWSRRGLFLTICYQSLCGVYMAINYEPFMIRCEICRPGHVSVLTSSKTFINKISPLLSQRKNLFCHIGWLVELKLKTDMNVTPACEMCSQKLSHILTSYITSSCLWLSAEPKHWQITLHPVLLKHINAEPWHVARMPMFIHHSSKSRHHLPFPLYSLIWLFYGLNEAFISESCNQVKC